MSLLSADTIEITEVIFPEEWLRGSHSASLAHSF